MKRALVLCFLASFMAGALVSVSPPAIGFKEVALPSGETIWVWALTDMQELNKVLGTLQYQNKVLRKELDDERARYKQLENQCI